MIHCDFQGNNNMEECSYFIAAEIEKAVTLQQTIEHNLCQNSNLPQRQLMKVNQSVHPLRLISLVRDPLNQAHQHQ